MLDSWPPWLVMWAISVAIFAACKVLTWTRVTVPAISFWQSFAYLFAWPGMDANAFLNPPQPSLPRPTVREWLFAVVKLVFGVILIWFLFPQVSIDQTFLRGWIGMVGLMFLLHFGSFHLLSCFWRAHGIDAKPLMNWPILAYSLAEFWGQRWNTAFRDLTHRFLFRPLARRIGPRAGLGVGFIASGLIHDLAISVPAGGGYGGPTLYFIIQGLGLHCERTTWGRRFRGRVFTLLVILAPTGILFHRPFLERVILPFLDVIGAH